MAKTVLITGASGLLGRQILRVFEEDAEWKTIGVAFSRAGGNLHKVDLTNFEDLRRAFEKFSPDVIIHAAAERRPDAVEQKQEATHALNVKATSNICKLAEEQKAFVLYVSTDYVFDGKNAPYKETDEPNPLNKYGESKLEGEKTVLAFKGNKASVKEVIKGFINHPELRIFTRKLNNRIKVPILYGPLEYLDESAVTTLFNAVQNTTKDCKMNDLQRRFPTHTEDVAKVLKNMVQRRLQDSSITGIYHWSGDENMTKYKMAVTMAEVFGLSTSHIKPDTTDSGGATRPYDAHLDSTKLEKLGICHRRPFESAIKECLKGFYEEGNKN